jgi:hypothetical protein
LVAAVRQMARARVANHTVGAVLFTALAAALYAAAYVTLAALAPGLKLSDWASTPLSQGLTGAVAVGWLAAVAGVIKSVLAVAQPNGWKSLAWLTLGAGVGLVAGPAVALLVF